MISNIFYFLCTITDLANRFHHPANPYHLPVYSSFFNIAHLLLHCAAKDATTITLYGGDAVFEAKVSVIKQAGWRAVFNEKEENGDETGNLPELRKGENLLVIQSEILQKQTKPKPLHRKHHFWLQWNRVEKK